MKRTFTAPISHVLGYVERKTVCFDVDTVENDGEQVIRNIGVVILEKGTLKFHADLSVNPRMDYSFSSAQIFPHWAPVLQKVCFGQSDIIVFDETVIPILSKSFSSTGYRFPGSLARVFNLKETFGFLRTKTLHDTYYSFFKKEPVFSTAKHRAMMTIEILNEILLRYQGLPRQPSAFDFFLDYKRKLSPAFFRDDNEINFTFDVKKDKWAHLYDECIEEMKNALFPFATNIQWSHNTAN